MVPQARLKILCQMREKRGPEGGRSKSEAEITSLEFSPVTVPDANYASIRTCLYNGDVATGTRPCHQPIVECRKLWWWEIYRVPISRNVDFFFPAGATRKRGTEKVIGVRNATHKHGVAHSLASDGRNRAWDAISRNSSPT